MVVLVSMRNYLMPGDNFFSDHVLKGKIKELACKELAAIVFLSSVTVLQLYYCSFLELRSRKLQKLGILLSGHKLESSGYTHVYMDRGKVHQRNKILL